MNLIIILMFAVCSSLCSKAQMPQLGCLEMSATCNQYVYCPRGSCWWVETGHRWEDSSQSKGSDPARHLLIETGGWRIRCSPLITFTMSFQSGGGEVWTRGLTTVTVRAAAEVIIFCLHQFGAMIIKLEVLGEAGGNGFLIIEFFSGKTHFENMLAASGWIDLFCQLQACNPET